MRILVYFNGHVLTDRGTPLRCRNLTTALNQYTKGNVKLVSRDKTAAIQNTLATEHQNITPDETPFIQLQSIIEHFRPHVVYGQTHKAMPDFVKLPPLKGVKRVVDIHGHYPIERLEQYWRPWHRRFVSFAKEYIKERNQMSKMDAFTVVCEALAVRVGKYGKPVQVLWGGVDPTLFKPGDIPTSKRISVVYAGNFRPYQGVSTLLQAAKLLVDKHELFHFTFIGDVDSFPAIREQIRRPLSEHVTFLGQIPYHQVPLYLSQADVLVIPRTCDRTALYGFPSKLPEYMAMGKSIILTDIGEHSKVVKQMETGILIPPDSADDLVQALLTLKDGSLRQRLGHSARMFAESELSWAHIGKQLYIFLQECAQ